MASPQVLVVEDHADVRESLAMLLEQIGYAPATATDGVEALEYLRSGHKPCIILLDLMMPRMDGLGFLNEQARDPALAKIPVAILSAYFELLAGSKHSNVVATLRKPVQWDDLLKVLRKACPPAGFTPIREATPE